MSKIYNNNFIIRMLYKDALTFLHWLDPKPNFLKFMAGLSKFMAAFRLSRKTAVEVFFG